MAGIGKSVATRIFSSLLTSTTNVPKEAEARVTRIDEDGVPWVAVAGSDEETPANGSVTSEAQVGQTVRVSAQGGKLSIVGNSTSPSVGGEYVQSVVAPVEELVEATSTVASAAQAIAAATNQHFFADGNGVHVTEAAGDATTEHNILINSLGILLRKATAPLAALSASAIAFYDGLGSAASNIVARFGADGSQIGRDGESHVELDYHSMQMVDSDGTTYFYVSDLRDSTGVAKITDAFTSDGSTTTFTLMFAANSTDYTVEVDGAEVTSGVTKTIRAVTFDTAPTDGATITVTYGTTSRYAKAYTAGLRGSGNVGAMSFAEGLRTDASGSYGSHAEGFETVASGLYGSHAEGYITTASGSFGSHAEGLRTTAGGGRSHAEGERTTASGINAHAEGGSTTASGDDSHAEGGSTTASGYSSHAEGYGTTASGRFSHAEGYGTTTYGDGAHAEGFNTTASSSAQTVLGKYNVEDANDAYALIIGNGTASQRSNALTVDWLGNVWAAGKATLTGAVEAASATITGALSAASATISGALSAASATITGLLTADRVKIASGGSKGLLTEDSTGFEYPLISDNGNNLWIGAHKAGEQHHTGGTFISAGAGRETIYVSVPNSDNTAATNYSVMHSGFSPVETTTISDIISAQTNVTVSAASFAQWGKVAMLNVTYTLDSTISVPVNGNASNTALFTIAAGKRPAMTLGVILDNNEGAWGTVNASGVVTLAGANSRGAAWTMNTTNNRYLQICYLLP